MTAEEREKLRKEAEARAKKYGIAFKEGKGHLTPPKGYPEDPDQYGDPVNYAYPIDREHIRAAIVYFNHEGQREAGGYTPEEWAIIGKRNAAAATKLLGAKYEYKNGKVVRVEPAGEIYAVQATISGEMRVEDVPLAPWANLEALKAGDPEPMEVVAEIPAGRSKRGWNYRPEALQAIVGEVMSQGLPGFLGHQKPEEVDHAFPTPVTHWVGALWKDGKAYFRGVVDKAASDLKRWIKANVVRTVSIFGVPKLQQVAGETQVVDYKPLSIDWTPLGRAGMPTAVVATGEMDEIAGELDGSHEELREALRTAAKALFGDGPGSYTWVRKVFDSYVIVEHEKDGLSKLYSIPYGVVDGEVKLGEKTEVVEKKTYEPVGEIYGGEGNMGWKELVKQLRAMLASGDVTLGQVVGEMGISADALAREMDDLKAAMEATDTLKKIKETLGVTGEMDVLDVAKKAKEAIETQAKAEHTKLVSDAVAEKVSGEMAQGLIIKMLDVPEDATKEKIAGEIDTLLADETVKAVIGKLYTDNPPVIGGSGGKGNEATTLRVKRQTI